MSSTENDSIIALESADGRSFKLPLKAARESEFVDSATNDENPSTKATIRLSSITGDCLEQVVAFLMHYQDEPLAEISLPLANKTFALLVEQGWYRDFVSCDMDALFQLVTAANYMGIKPLLDLTCLKLAFEVTGKTPGEIRQILNMPPLTPEEEAKAREEHPGIFREA